jgi:hypothetical protein
LKEDIHHLINGKYYEFFVPYSYTPSPLFSSLL